VEDRVGRVHRVPRRALPGSTTVRMAAARISGCCRTGR
jgi:hypothetical protein